MLLLGSKLTSSPTTLPSNSIKSPSGTRSAPLTPSLPASSQPLPTSTTSLSPTMLAASRFRPRLSWTCWGCHTHHLQGRLIVVHHRLLYRSCGTWRITGHRYWLTCTHISHT
ncbi:hypothetical protein LINPERPRIM_LOCUS36546 [Linum perenne]